MLRRQLALATIAAIGVAGTPQLASAQGGFTLEEVVVTARKRTESLQDIPVSVTAFSQQDLAAYNMTQTADLAAFTPSLFIETNSSQNLSSLKTTIRGQVQADSLSTLDPSVGWYIDDVYLARTVGTAASMFDLERVEVLKGPQGTLYGRNTTGGAIRLITAKPLPSGEVEGFVTGTYGKFNQQRLGGAINIPLIKDVLAVRLTALKDDVKDGYGSVLVKPAGPELGGVFPGLPALYPGNPYMDFEETRKNAGQRDSEMFRLGVNWRPNDSTNVQFSYERSDLYANALLLNTVRPLPNFGALAGNVFVPPLQDVYDGGAVNALQEAWNEADTAALTVEYDISETLNTKLVLGWRDMESSFLSDVDGTAAPLNWFVEPFRQNAEQRSVEWQLGGEAMDGRLDWLTGLYYFEEEGIDFSTSGGTSAYLGSLATGRPQIHSTFNGTIDKNESRSAFVSLTYELTDTVNVTGGVRYTEDEKPVTVETRAFFRDGSSGCRFDVNTAPNVNPVDCTWGDSKKYDYVSWTVGADWSVNDAVMLYVKSASSNRSGGQNLRGLGIVELEDGSTINTFQPFDPEEVTDLELGMKGTFFDYALQVNAAYYHIWYTDVQQSNLISTPSGLTTFVSNASEADFDGIEVDVKWVISEQLMLIGTAALIDWSFEDNTDFANSAPEEEFTMRANYRIPADYGTWDLDLNYSYRGEFYANSSTTRQALDASKAGVVDSVGLWGGRVGLALNNGVEIALWGKNLSDKEYTLSPLVLSTPADLYSMGVGAPRSYGLDFTYRF